MADRVFVMGAGRAGSALARALHDSGVAVVGLHGRRSSSGAESSLTASAPHPVVYTHGPLPATIASANVILVTVRDSQLNDAFAELVAAPLNAAAVVLHASGSAEPSGIRTLRDAGHHAGTFHPLVPLASDAGAADRLRNSWIGIDGDSGALRASRALAAALGARVIIIPDGHKISYHAAAVLASNFPVVLAHLATRRLVGDGVASADAAAAVISLMHASVENLRGRDPAQALTGPVVRGDSRTVAEHVRVLSETPDDGALDAYLALTLVAVEMARAQNADERALAEIGEALSRRS